MVRIHPSQLEQVLEMSLANALGLTEKEFMKIVSETTCSGCKWHDEFSWVCVNADSEYVADFVNDGCERYEK